MVKKSARSKSDMNLTRQTYRNPSSSATTLIYKRSVKFRTTWIWIYYGFYILTFDHDCTSTRYIYITLGKCDSLKVLVLQ